MQIAIASGKGGTGKTTLTAALTEFLAGRGKSIHVYDCDVEEPNTNLFLKSPIETTEPVTTLIPVVDMDSCTGCGKCEEICEFSAIVLIKGKPLVFPDMCHSCGGCMLVCPERAITETEKEIGMLERGGRKNIRYTGGTLKISEAMTPPLIKAVKKDLTGADILVIDSPPGTSCPVIEAVRDSDYVILVTEPTPFGMNDLELAVEMMREVGIPFGVVINRADSGDSRVINYCKDEGIDVIAEIPDSREVAERYSRGEFVEYFLSEFGAEIKSIADRAGI